MCGLAGFLTLAGTSDTNARTYLSAMADAITHRGPDDAGYWSDVETGIGLAHRRLSIIDLSETGHQPMVSASGRYVVVYNGEIYNHLELREQIEALGEAAWRGHSDTETLLAGIENWGLEGTLKRLNGMFAIAVWDKSERRLFLARDRIGEKPLYFGWQGSGTGRTLLFGSEIKAMRRHPAFGAAIDRQSLTQLMRHNYIPAPRTIFENIHKLEPATLLCVSADGSMSKRQYWSGIEVAQRGLQAPLQASDPEAVGRLEVLLRDAVKRQMAADVPLGAFLSGGIDSSLIVALMQSQSARPIKTFTIGFSQQAFNEAEHAAAVASHLGTEHTELYLSEKQALDVVSELGRVYDEPFSDSSQIPTLLLARMTREHVTVALSGDAGDELFCGYNRYMMFERTYSALSRVPRPLRLALSRGITGISPDTWNAISRPLSGVMPSRMRLANIGDKLHKAAGILGATSAEQYYVNLISHTTDPASLVVNGDEGGSLERLTDAMPAGLPAIEKMMLLDMLSYLPDDILVKVDRASMSASLETRVPFLDHRIVEFAWSMPRHQKLRDGVGKWALREVLYKYVPRQLIERPKTGFGVPLADWLRGALREWAEAMLDETRLQKEGYFNSQLVRQKWSEHLSGQRNWSYQLWDILMFQNWLDAQ